MITHSLGFSSAASNITATLALDPVDPQPKSTVTVTIKSYSFDANTTKITWKVNGSVALEGIGEKTLTLKTGQVGETSNISVVAETADGDSVEKKIQVTPSSVVLLYEAPKSYVPHFYEGRSLPSDGALVRVSAMPQISDGGVPVSPSSLSYTWFLNDTPMKSMSGLGKQSAVIRLDYLKIENEIKVLVRSTGGNSGTNKVVIVTHPIMPLLYTFDPIFGTDFKKVIEKRFETIQDFTLALEPFYVSQKEEVEPTFSWFLDGLPVSPLGGKVLGLHPKNNSEGRNLLTIKVNGPDKRIQQAETKLDIFFDTRK